MSTTLVASETTAAINYRGHIGELDSLRAFGIGIVLINHFWFPSLSMWIFDLGRLGWIAMDSFFVLSGFLITGILLDTCGRADYFRNYYIRRCLRIFPLYYASLLIIFVIAHLARKNGVSEYANMLHTWGSPAWFVFYLGNFRLAWVGHWPAVTTYSPLWSLQIEEQFYLLFPFAIRFLSLKQLSRLMWTLVVLSPVFRVLFFLWNPHNIFPQYVLLPCHMEGLALGALIAIRVRSGPWRLSKIALAASAAGLLLVAAIASSIGPPTDWWQGRFTRLAGFSISSFGCACLILLLILLRGSKYTRLLRTTPVRYVANISYGIYLLHLIAARCIRALSKIGIHLAPASFARFATVVALSVLLASLSWHFFESPLLRLKDRIAPRRGPEGEPETRPSRLARPSGMQHEAPGFSNAS